MEYKEFHVLVRDRYNITITRPSGIRDDDRKVPMDSLRERTIQMFNRWLADGNITTRDELEILGSHLFEGLFDNEASNAFREEWEKIRNQSQPRGLRLVLEFALDARELAEMPWEYIYYPGKKYERGYFLATVNRLILARHVPQSSEVSDPEERPLRILIVVSKPQSDERGEEELGPIKDGPVIEDIEALRSQWPGAIVTDKLLQPTKRKLVNKVEQFHPHVLHLIGHGKYTDAEGGALALVSEEDENLASWISDRDLADCFLNYRPRLIFLHACEGASSKSYRAFRGVALQLVYSRIPAVVAMQYQVENKVAIRFARVFYQSLGEGKRIDEAVQAGRLELGMYLNDGKGFSSRAFGSPVVYLQSAEGIIIAEAQASAETLQSSSVTPAGLSCPNCNSPATRGQKYCRRCGKALMLCPKCGLDIISKDGSSTCGNCGYAVSTSDRIEPNQIITSAREGLQSKNMGDAKIDLMRSISGPLLKKPLSWE